MAGAFGVNMPILQIEQLHHIYRGSRTIEPGYELSLLGGLSYSEQSHWSYSTATWGPVLGCSPCPRSGFMSMWWPSNTGNQKIRILEKTISHLLLENLGWQVSVLGASSLILVLPLPVCLVTSPCLRAVLVVHLTSHSINFILRLTYDCNCVIFHCVCVLFHFLLFLLATVCAICLLLPFIINVHAATGRVYGASISSIIVEC